MSKTTKRKRPHRTWQEVAAEAQAERDASIRLVSPPLPPLSSPLSQNVMNIPGGQVLTPHEIHITSLPPETLIRRLASREWTAVEVVNAFLRRAALAQHLTNSITELLPARALSRARNLDDYLATHGTTIGPLHGLPISVKEHLGIKGLKVTSGWVANWDVALSEDDAEVVRVLERVGGAVAFARTTEPQGLMMLETENNLYGRTVNPYNTDLSSGGSSGGESALIGLRGSCLGIGTDVGGSIRSPAAACGLYGLKPTSFRVPTSGWSSTPPAVDPIPTVIGPLSTSLAGISLFMSVVLSSKPWLKEPALIPLPWTPITIDPTPTRPLRIAIMSHDGVVKPHPPISRALEAVRGRLENLSNVEVLDWRPHLHNEAWAIISSLYYPDGGAEEAELIARSGEPWLPLLKWIVKENPCVRKLDPKGLQYWQEEREAYRTEYAKVWNETAKPHREGRGDGNDDDDDDDDDDDRIHPAPGDAEFEGCVDAILCPVGPGVAPRHGTAKYWGYTCVWNLLDYPAVVFPVDKVRESDVEGIWDEKRNGELMNDVDGENWRLWTNDPSDFLGVPICLQLVGRRFEDEKILGVLEYIKNAIDLPFAEFP